jgi:hypothetical protein
VTVLTMTRLTKSLFIVLIIGYGMNPITLYERYNIGKNNRRPDLSPTPTHPLSSDICQPPHLVRIIA